MLKIKSVFYDNDPSKMTAVSCDFKKNVSQYFYMSLQMLNIHF